MKLFVGYSTAPEQPQSNARPICQSHTMTNMEREPATIRIAAYRSSQRYAIRQGRRQLEHHQRMQNIAARIVSRCPYRDHITAVLESLHLLSVKFRILFKLFLLTYKCLNGLASGSLSCLVLPRKHRYAPRPQHQGKLQVPEVRLKSYRERSFGFSAPVEWNKLPVDVKLTLTLVSLKAKLKTHLYKIYYK